MDETSHQPCTCKCVCHMSECDSQHNKVDISAPINVLISAKKRVNSGNPAYTRGPSDSLYHHNHYHPSHGRKSTSRFSTSLPTLPNQQGLSSEADPEPDAVEMDFMTSGNLTQTASCSSSQATGAAEKRSGLSLSNLLLRRRLWSGQKSISPYSSRSSPLSRESPGHETQAGVGRSKSVQNPDSRDTNQIDARYPVFTFD